MPGGHPVANWPEVSQRASSLVAPRSLARTINAVRSKFRRPFKQALLSRRLHLGARGDVSSFIYHSASQVKSTLSLATYSTTFGVLFRHPTGPLNWRYLECTGQLSNHGKYFSTSLRCGLLLQGKGPFRPTMSRYRSRRASLLLEERLRRNRRGARWCFRLNGSSALPRKPPVLHRTLTQGKARPSMYLF